MKWMLFSVVALVAFFSPLWLTTIFFLLYIIRYSGYELFIIAFFVDAQFGMYGYGGFTYTLIVAALLITAALIKPNLRMYNA